ncbi:MAG: outer membrane efflux protein, partial [Elusimicrobia bacterium]
AARARQAAGPAADPVLALDRDSLGAGENSFLLEWTPDISGGRGLLRAAAGASASAAESAARLAGLGLRAEVLRAFYALLLAQEVSREHRSAASRLKALAGITRAAPAGRNAYDRLRLEVEFAAAQAEAGDAFARVEETRCALSALLGSADCAELLAQGTLLPPVMGPAPSPAAEPAGPRPHPALEMLSAEADVRDAERRFALSRNIPGLSLRGGLKTSDGDSAGQAGVALSLPLSGSGRRAAEAAAGRRDETLARLEEARLGLSAAGAAARLRLEKRMAAAAARGSEVLPQAERLEREAALGYTEGRLGVPELVDAFRTALRVRVALLEAAYEARLAYIGLKLAGGE